MISPFTAHGYPQDSTAVLRLAEALHAAGADGREAVEARQIENYIFSVRRI